MSAHLQRVRWSKRERALLYCFDGDKPTSMLIAYALETVRVHEGGDGVERSLAAELERRGYDLTTLRFSVKPKTGGIPMTPPMTDEQLAAAVKYARWVIATNGDPALSGTTPMDETLARALLHIHESASLNTERIAWSVVASIGPALRKAEDYRDSLRAKLAGLESTNTELSRLLHSAEVDYKAASDDRDALSEKLAEAEQDRVWENRERLRLDGLRADLVAERDEARAKLATAIEERNAETAGWRLAEETIADLTAKLARAEGERDMFKEERDSLIYGPTMEALTLIIERETAERIAARLDTLADDAEKICNFGHVDQYAAAAEMIAELRELRALLATPMKPNWPEPSIGKHPHQLGAALMRAGLAARGDK